MLFLTPASITFKSYYYPIDDISTTLFKNNTIKVYTHKQMPILSTIIHRT
jgi:hypothetical protein